MVLYSLAIGFSLNLVVVIMFYAMLQNNNPRIIVDANSYGEYWFEFFMLQICLILTFSTFILESYNYFFKN